MRFPVTEVQLARIVAALGKMDALRAKQEELHERINELHGAVSSMLPPPLFAGNG